MELNKDCPLLQFDEVYVLKLVPGKEAYISRTGAISCTSDYLGPKYLGHHYFDEIQFEYISGALLAFGVENILIQGIISSHKKPKFYVTDVKFNNDFLAVPHAANVAAYLRLPFVRYKKMSTKSLRRIKKYSPVEIRPLDEFVDENGRRMICRYDRKEKI